MVKIDWKMHGCKHCPFLLPKFKNTSVCIDFAHILKKKMFYKTGGGLNGVIHYCSRVRQMGSLQHNLIKIINKQMLVMNETIPIPLSCKGCA